MIISEAGILYDGLESVGIQTLMVWDGNAVYAIGHAGMFALGYNSEAGFEEGFYCAFRGDIGKKQLRPVLLPDTLWRLWSPLQSYGDMC